MKPVAVLCLKLDDYERWTEDHIGVNSVMITPHNVMRLAGMQISKLEIANPQALVRLTGGDKTFILSRICPGHRPEDERV